MIDPLRTFHRCESTQGALRCCGEVNHLGDHWADTGRAPAVFRWGMTGYGCSDTTCIRVPGHELPHRDGKGCSWRPCGIDEYNEDDLFPKGWLPVATFHREKYFVLETDEGWDVYHYDEQAAAT